MSKERQITPEQAAALDLFARSHGVHWKRQLLTAWQRGTDDKEPGGCYLRQLRNNFGPTWLGSYQCEPCK